METLSSIVGKIAEYTVEAIARQIRYFIYYEDNFTDLKYEVDKLEAAREAIQHLIEAEKTNGKEIEADVVDWLYRVDDITEAVKKPFEDAHPPNSGCSKWSIPHLKSRHRLSRNAKKMARDVVELLERGKFDRVSDCPPLDVQISSVVPSDSEKLESRKLMKEHIKSALTDPGLSRVGIYGIGGVGKSKLVEEVAREVRYDKLFDAVVMTILSSTPDVRGIQGEIADQLGLRFDEESTVGRASRLRARIKDEKYILIILDDIWAPLDLEALGIPSVDDNKGCKLLLTSGNKDILQKMDTQMNFRLEVLNEEETWNLFKATAGDDVKDTSLQQVAKEVAKKCGGLPVLVVTIARALKNKDIEYWKDALYQLESVGNREINDITYSALEHSYVQLEEDATKTLFLLCAVLETSPSLHNLLKYAMGLDIFKHIITMQDARSRLHKMVSELKASCLLLEDDKSDQVNMHDFVRDVAISIASKDQYFFVKIKDKLKEWPTEDFLKRCTAIILNHCNIKKLPERLDCPNLKLFYLNGADNPSLEMPDLFFLGMKNLQVLALTCIEMSALSTSLGSLADLKTLCLDHCMIEDLTGIGTLKNLEILSLVKSTIKKLPRETAQLANLRMLDLSNSEIEVIPSNIISNLTKLEELYMVNASIKWGVEYSSTQKNVSLFELRHLPYLTVLQIQILEVLAFPRDLMFENLQKYDIVVGDLLGWPDIHYGTSKTLKLKLDTWIHIEQGIKALIRRAENLYLDEVNGISNVLCNLNGEGLPFLKHLHIQNNATIKHIINSVERVEAQHIIQNWPDLFPRLETLVLCNLSYLDEICCGPLSFISFKNLKIIKVKKCDRLRYLFSSSMLKQLYQLLEIEVSECNSLKEIVLAETGDSIDFPWLRTSKTQHLPALDELYSYELASSEIQQMPLFNSKIVFPSLKILKLTSLNLKKIWDNDGQLSATSLRYLTSLTVDDCGDLTFLFTSSMVGILSNLETLEVSKCHKMEEILKATEEGRTETKVEFLNLKILKLSSLNLKKIWDKEGQLSATSLRYLTSLTVDDCGDLTFLFTSSMVGILSNLETLEVSKCHQMEEILKATTEEGINQTDEGLFPKLKTIRITDMENLKTMLQLHDPPAPDSFGRLRRMEVKNCPKLVSVFSMIKS